jgi:hypothetical protein
MERRGVRVLVDERLVTKEHLDHALKELEYRLTFRLGALVLLSFSITIV